MSPRTRGEPAKWKPSPHEAGCHAWTGGEGLRQLQEDFHPLAASQAGILRADENPRSGGGGAEREQREGMFRGGSRESEADRRRSPAGVLCFRPRRCRTQAPPLPASTLLALLTVIDESEPSILS